MKRVLVVAGTYQQFREWCRKNEVPVRDATYVDVEYKIRGLSPDNAHAVVLPFESLSSRSEREDRHLAVIELERQGFKL